MNWEDYALARQVLVEEHIGTLVREAKRAEDKAASKAKTNIARSRR